MVEVYGQVNDESPNGLSVQLSGVVNGTLTTDSYGYFVGTLPASSLGTITASVTDVWGQVSDSYQTNVYASPPSISMSAMPDPSGGSQINGSVTGSGSVSGLALQLSGVVSQTLTTDASGYFNTSVTPGVTGTVYATVTDVWGQTSDPAQIQLEDNTPPDNAPTLSFSVYPNGSGTMVDIYGQVYDESPSGLAVQLSGVVNGSLTTDMYGYFSGTLRRWAPSPEP